MALVAPVAQVALLDGRYQLIRQLGGPPRAPLMVASDLQTGRVVCIRLQRFSISTASLAAVPLLAPHSHLSGDGPLLPYDFGVDEGTTYVVRDFVTATNLEQRLADPGGLTPLDVVSILRRAGEATLTAAEQGFRHPGLALRHLLVTPDGAVRVSGYDGIQHARRGEARDGEMLVALLPQAFAGIPGVDLPPAVRTLLTRCKTWQATGVPDLETVVRHVRRCEEQLLGYSWLGEGIRRVARVCAAAFRRFRRLGPLLHPYVIVLALVIAIVLLAGHALASPVNPGRLVVYPVPTHEAVDPATMYPFANPPQVLAPTTTSVATATSTTTTANIADITATTPPRSASKVNEADREAPAASGSATTRPEREVAQASIAPRVILPPSTRREIVAEPMATTARRQSDRRQNTTLATTSRPVAKQTASAEGRSTVIVTSLTAQATTARVTIIAATSTPSITARATVRSTSSAVTYMATSAAAGHSVPAQSSATTASRSTAGTVVLTTSVSRSVATGR